MDNDATIIILGIVIMVGVCSVLFMASVLLVFIVTETKESLRYRRRKREKKRQKANHEHGDFFAVVKEIMDESEQYRNTILEAGHRQLTRDPNWGRRRRDGDDSISYR